MPRELRRRPLRTAKRAFDVALDAVPDSVLERLAAATAPLTRYSGRTAAGAAALSSALTVLAQPPRMRHRRAASYRLEEIAASVDEPEQRVREWADSGLLGEPSADGTWPRSAADRATLLAVVAKRGSNDAEIADAAVDGRLPLIVLEHVIAGEATLTSAEAARRAGVPLEFALGLWRALGFPIADVNDRMCARDEVAALRVIGAMRSVFTDDDIMEAATVLGRALSEVSAAATELFRRRLTQRYLESGATELETSLRLAALTDLMVPTLGPLMEVVLRRHLAVAARIEAALQMEQSGVATSQRPLAVAFADIVGFTSASEQLSALEVGTLASRLYQCAEQSVVPQGGRIVKSIGDAIMFTAKDSSSAAHMAVDLIRSAAEGGLPPVRAGVAHGPVMRAYADYFGRTVNIAARLCDAAPAGTVLLHSENVDAEALRHDGLVVKGTKRMRVRGIDTALPVVTIETG
ncbi:MAG: hypothetical protein JOZ92_08725 [Candidatus Dormibacteraeota bacterium]|nr:hypothetical protein [Candidatus Dormibacteraeota bacterium]